MWRRDVVRVSVMSFLPGLRRSSPTNWWMRQPAFWQVPGSSTAVWRSWCMTISTGLTCLSASSTKSSSWLVAASSVPRHGISCVPVSEMAQKRRLRSAAGHQLVVPSYRLNLCGLRAFSVLGPRLWNSLPRLLCDTSHSTASFGHSLKTFFLSEY